MSLHGGRAWTSSKRHAGTAGLAVAGAALATGRGVKRAVSATGSGARRAGEVTSRRARRGPRVAAQDAQAVTTSTAAGRDPRPTPFLAGPAMPAADPAADDGTDADALAEPVAGPASDHAGDALEVVESAHGSPAADTGTYGANGAGSGTGGGNGNGSGTGRGHGRVAASVAATATREVGPDRAALPTPAGGVSTPYPLPGGATTAGPPEAPDGTDADADADAETLPPIRRQRPNRRAPQRPRDGVVVPLRVPWMTRLRATAGLCAMVVFLGTATATVIGAIAVGVAQALGSV